MCSLYTCCSNLLKKWLTFVCSFSRWIGILVFYFTYKEQFECKGGEQLRNYLLVLMVLLAGIILNSCIIVGVSMQGTITNPGPRRAIPTLIYIRAILYLPEVIWGILGIIWVSDESLDCSSTLIVGVILAIVVSWIILFFTLVAVLVVFDPLGKPKKFEYYLNHNLESSESDQLLYKARTVAARVWEHRLKLLCCCIMQDDEVRTAFSSLGELFGGFFMDTDLVPSDIAAGLSLLHQEQDKIEQTREPEVVCHNPAVATVPEELDMELDNAAHYMLFAVAAYGWPIYVFTNPLTGFCNLSRDCRCCISPAAESDIVGGDHLGCHLTSMIKITGLQYRDFIHISFHNKIYEIPFYVALDHKTEAVLVAVRGTLSLRDVLTDLSTECENLNIDGMSEGCFAHKGILHAASYIYRKLVTDGILSQAFVIAPEYKLVVTGHSLGAGAATILAIMLHKSYPGLKCYAFSPPGGLLSKTLADYTKDFIISVIVGKDFVPRLSLCNMEDLKRRILRIVANCNRPKYQILLRGCWYEIFGGDPDNFPTEMESRRQETLTRPLLADHSLMGHRSSSYNSLLDGSPPISPSKNYPLFLPGKIIHIQEDYNVGSFCRPEIRYRAVWSESSAFNSILISPKIISDHMPDIVLKALTSLTREEPFILCAPGGGSTV
uniref:Diacylglycerol lipase-beta n=1 Tax=Callorhinchus milii TaxID=7868 RepID=V9KDF3_CALMI